MKILVTGGAGFIGSEFVRQIAKDHKVIVVDKLTYAGDLARLSAIDGKFKFCKIDICNQEAIESIFKKERPETVVNFSAETHVDRSIQDCGPFIAANIRGVQILLDACRKYNIKKYIQISTDEIYGEIEKGRFNEDSPFSPNSPYSASKAAADLLIRSYARTYGFPAIIVRPSNNYGPWQYPEKLLPVVIYKALKNQAVPVYAKGLNIREWLHVSDCARGIISVLNRGCIGGIYNLGSGQERTNIEVVKRILGILGKPRSLIRFVQDRPGHDVRYSLDSSKIRKLGWKPEQTFSRGLEETVNWYVNNLSWLENKVCYLRSYWKKVYK